MYKYPKMISILARNYSYQESAELMEMGRSCLQALCFEIAYEYKIKICNKDLIKMIPDIMQSELKLNSLEQLLHFFGKNIFIKHDQYERQITKETVLTIINQYNHPEIPNFLEPSRHYLYDFESQFEQSQSDEISLTPQLKVCESKEQIFKTEGSFMQAFLPQILVSSDGDIKKEKEEILCYIASLTIPKTQLSQFCQSVKNNFPSYNRQKIENIYHVTAILIFDNFFTNHVARKYEFKTKFANLKRAQNQAALGLLEQIWTDYPLSWRRFTENRNK